ncbi:MAG: 5-(carboxyamino)imidazole ribonucleotide mutase [Oligoflexia bacterium]|nr:5-(carboxyamino)imidazole ribonucleotide mutase [Oligoflexia bacterium]
MTQAKVRVVVVMGSQSDLKIMKSAVEALKKLKVNSRVEILSAHRTPQLLEKQTQVWLKQGIKVIIAGAGGAAHLPGMLASFSVIPVIGVPVSATRLNGLDSLLSIVQMPKGIPVATVAIDNAYNAGLLAAQMLAVIEGSQTAIAGVSRFRKQIKSRVLRDRKALGKWGLNKILKAR